ncbi:hypothetical protein FB451DRAFT_1552785 [Mycena latifolia]|nr:hypothetical protein FB451DRAFT_1552785 [Mycena latifolia]
MEPLGSTDTSNFSCSELQDQIARRLEPSEDLEKTGKGGRKRRLQLPVMEPGTTKAGPGPLRLLFSLFGPLAPQRRGRAHFKPCIPHEARASASTGTRRTSTLHNRSVHRTLKSYARAFPIGMPRTRGSTETPSARPESIQVQSVGGAALCRKSSALTAGVRRTNTLNRSPPRASSVKPVRKRSGAPQSAFAAFFKLP